ncbi:E3 14.7K [bat adenovirus 10]|uniref:E3 14.7K n=1 Tax=bat adenovirus 10 TaxID=3070193 RepID=A0A1X9RIW1_9ADEN|nr:E3 14.7K [Bat mastadenovirus WIV18]ARQ79792.1 E3 14.7K [bat adenovirus 10]
MTEINMEIASAETARMDDVAEQQRLLEEANRNIHFKKMDELQKLQNSHRCEKGSFCGVKHAVFDWFHIENDHCLKFHVGSSKRSTVIDNVKCMIKYKIMDYGYAGKIICGCTNQDCCPDFIQNICKIDSLR